MLKHRIITALILISLLAAALSFLDYRQFSYLVLVVFGVAAWEWANLSGLQKPVYRIPYAVVIMALVYSSIYVSNLYSAIIKQDLLRDIVGAGCFFWALSLLWVKTYPASTPLWGSVIARAVMGVFVLVPSATSLVFLTSLQNGVWIFCYLIFIVAAADVGAYFTGKAFGKRKLAPNVSPGKSWAGFFGGLACAILFSLVVGLNFQVAGLALIELLVVSGITSLSSVLGDLVESMVKRHRGIKDSSQLLPGHGGVMDRVDSITAAAPVFSLFVILL